MAPAELRAEAVSTPSAGVAKVTGRPPGLALQIGHRSGNYSLSVTTRQ
jgi:hypothetical protein